MSMLNFDCELHSCSTLFESRRSSYYHDEYPHTVILATLVVSVRGNGMFDAVQQTLRVRLFFSLTRSF